MCKYFIKKTTFYLSFAVCFVSTLRKLTAACCRRCKWTRSQWSLTRDGDDEEDWSSWQRAQHPRLLYTKRSVHLCHRPGRNFVPKNGRYHEDISYSNDFLITWMSEFNGDYTYPKIISQIVTYSLQETTRSVSLITQTSLIDSLHSIRRCGLLLQMSHVAWSVCVSVCLSTHLSSRFSKSLAGELLKWV